MLTAPEIYDKLLQVYGKPRWWSDDPYQVMVEAALVQHTTWSSLKKLRPILSGELSPVHIEALPQEDLEELIRPCGFQKAKTRTIGALTGWVLQYGRDVAAIRSRPLVELRAALLALRGICAETADVILAYAFHLPSFIVDAYTRTFLGRLGFPFVDDMEIKGFVEGNLQRDAELYGSFHWLILEHCISRCKKKPVCEVCSFRDCCAYINVQ